MLYECRFTTLIENQQFIPLLRDKTLFYVDTHAGAFTVDDNGEATVEKVTANRQKTFILNDKLTHLSHVTTIKENGLAYHVKNLTLLGEDSSTILQGHCTTHQTFL
ncbi:hypothetical protein H0A36_10215 [Endozoicomonas sp. SM1973]|uniref:Uncharacterized protein n=2 Tax=Spartinivicinus marinus TaxID=2994442 RepID=A0A853IAW8_9GAMM|nr:hypothetical protein [Spartinivicinus marinus]